MKARAIYVALALLGVIGCGQKGPLYLPDHAGAVVTRPAGASQNSETPQPAAQQPAATSGPGTDAGAPAAGPAGPGKKNPGKDDSASSQK